MIAEIVIASLIVFVVVYIFYRNIRDRLKGNCDCNECTCKCSKYMEK